ncbi:MAG: hypothetical protein MZU84_08920 [Sphingobacterium sp.]|nr:hypothetical protein [Sphingobacterium sp.]
MPRLRSCSSTEGTRPAYVKDSVAAVRAAARPRRAQDRRGRGPHDHAHQAGVRVRDQRILALRQDPIVRRPTPFSFSRM